MKLLSMLYNKIFGTTDSKKEINHHSDVDLTASVLIGVDKNQQYFFDVRWSYDDPNRTANDLANLILGLSYGLFVNQVKSLLINYDIENKPYDELILYKTIEIMEERANILNNLVVADSEAPIIRPSNVFRPNTDENKRN